MTLDPAIFRALVAQGATPEMLLAVVEADAAVREERLAKKRADTAARVRRHRAKFKAGKGCNALQSVTEGYAEAAPPNDIYSNPPREPVEAKASTSPFGEKLVEAWNAGPAARGARKATKLDASRRTLLAARLRDHTEADVLTAVANLAASKFHCGANDRQWRANLGWLLKAENFLKALEMGDATPAKPVDMAEYRATMDRLAAKGFTADAGGEIVRPDRPPGLPRPFGQLAAGIAGNAAAH